MRNEILFNTLIEQLEPRLAKPAVPEEAPTRRERRDFPNPLPERTPAPTKEPQTPKIPVPARR